MERRVERLRRIAGSEAAQDADVELCRRDFWHWLSHYGWLYNPHETDEPARRQVPFVPWDSQRGLMSWLLERMEAGQEALVPKSRKIGVTWLVLHYLWWAHRFQRGFTALIGSRKEMLVDESGNMDSLFGKLRWLAGLQPSWLRPGPRYVDKHLLLADPDMETELAGESTNEGFGQGGRRTIVFIDEAGKVETRVMRLIWTAIESVARSVWIVFNPPPLASHFVWQVRMEAHPSRVYPMTWQADPTRPDDFKERTIRPRGRLTEGEFAEQYECQAGAVIQGRVWPVSVPELLYGEGHPEIERIRQTSPLLGGMDFGSSLISRSVWLLALLEKSTPWRLWIEWDLSWIQAAWPQIAADVRRTLAGYPPRNFMGTFYDPAGRQTESTGKSWVLNLAQAGLLFRDLQAHVDATETRWKLNTTEWIAWSARWLLTFMDSGQIRVHERCRYLRQCITDYRYNVPLGMNPLDHAAAARGPVKDDASHGADALRHLFTGAFYEIERERAAGRRGPEDPRPRDPDVQAWHDLENPGGPWG
jgi:hypothetical protein